LRFGQRRHDLFQPAYLAAVLCELIFRIHRLLSDLSLTGPIPSQ
jgi:hypothetical protein